MAEPAPQDVERKVDEYLGQDHLLKELGAKVVPGTARHAEYGWTVAVGVVNEPKRKFEFYDVLSQVEERLAESEHLDVMIAPSGVRPQMR